MKRVLSCFFLTIAIVVLAGKACPAQTSLQSHDSKISSAVLEILVDGRLTGCGWFASLDGLAITAAHNLKQAHKIEILSKPFGRLNAKLIASDLAHDLALLKADRHAGFYPSLKISSPPLRSGEELNAYGSAFFRHNLLFVGQVANPDLQYEWNEVNQCYTEVYYLSAMTPEGLSGAPWVNSAGEVVGIQSGMVAWRGALMGIAFVAPATAVEDLLTTKKNNRFQALGATVAESWEAPATMVKTAAKSGLYITRILPGGAADLSGLKQGDLILKANGEKILYRSELLSLIRNSLLESTLTITILRDDKTLELTFKLLDRD